jgi:hypothetical protein
LLVFIKKTTIDPSGYLGFNSGQAIWKSGRSIVLVASPQTTQSGHPGGSKKD